MQRCARICTWCRACCASRRSTARRCSPKRWSRSRSYLSTPAVAGKNQAEGLDALMRAMVQLPSYLERVLAAGATCALVLLPLLNDLRAVRGSALLSEGTLLLLNLQARTSRRARPPARRRTALTVAQWARQLRPRFQLGLLGLDPRRARRAEPRDPRDRRRSSSSRSRPRSRCSSCGGWSAPCSRRCATAALETGVSIKRLLGHADREIRRLHEQGEARYAQNPPVELLNNLLYYVARAPPATVRA